MEIDSPLFSGAQCIARRLVRGVDLDSTIVDFGISLGVFSGRLVCR
jgi:hypothetical protein